MNLYFYAFILVKDLFFSKMCNCFGNFQFNCGLHNGIAQSKQKLNCFTYSVSRTQKTIGLCFAMKPIDGTFRTDLVWRNLCLFVDKVKQVNNEQRVRNETIIWHLAFYQKVSSDSPDDSSNSCMLMLLSN